MKPEKIANIETELLELKSRARRVGYKNIIPQLSAKAFIHNGGLSDSIMSGFNKRLSNWKKGLILLENPSGLIATEVIAKKEAEFVASTTALAEHFNAQ